jgi:hypothetical protein
MYTAVEESIDVAVVDILFESETIEDAVVNWLTVC